jgi:glucose-1-phosphate adenylyltransferase
MLERRGREKVMAFVMAGGEGSRLRPLTADRCKPAVPFGSRYRIVDFVLSNLATPIFVQSICWCNTCRSR